MIAIFAAFKEEIRDYLKAGRFRVVEREGSFLFYLSELRPRIVVVEGGFGNERAAEAVRTAIERYNPETIVSAGFAGAVRNDLVAGDLILCERLLCLEGPAALWGRESPRERLSKDDGLLRRLIGTDSHTIRSGGCLTVPQLVSSRSMKEWIGRTYPVSLVDMESFWAGEAASEAKLPFVAVRAVLDPIDQTLPPFVGRSADNPDGLLWLRALRYLTTRPAEAPQLLRLRSQSRVARASLAGFLSALSPTSVGQSG